MSRTRKLEFRSFYKKMRRGKKREINRFTNELKTKHEEEQKREKREKRKKRVEREERFTPMFFNGVRIRQILCNRDHFKANSGELKIELVLEV